jgi:hypothetical protein
MDCFYFVLNILCAQFAAQESALAEYAWANSGAAGFGLFRPELEQRRRHDTCPVQRGASATGMLSKCCRRNHPSQLRDAPCW